MNYYIIFFIYIYKIRDLKINIYIYISMPSLNYCCETGKYFESDEEKKKYNNNRKNVFSKIFYWKKNFNYIVKFEDYEKFNENVKYIRNIKNIKKFIKDDYEVGKFYEDKKNQEIYAKNYVALTKIDPILDFLKGLEIVD